MKGPMHSPVDRLCSVVDHHEHLVPGNFLSALVTKSALFPQIDAPSAHAQSVVYYGVFTIVMANRSHHMP